MRFSFFAYCMTLWLGAFCLLTSCKKSPDVTPPVTTPTPPVTNTTDTTRKPTDSTNTNPAPTNAADTTYDPQRNQWECEVDGVLYRGTIDTSFSQEIFPEQAPHPDTLITCSGTSLDKKANIHMRITINRYYNPGAVVSTQIRGLLVFDTTSSTILKASFNSQAEIRYKVDSLHNNRVQVSFSGTIKDHNVINGPLHTVTKGSFRCQLGTGNKEPRSFAYTDGTEKFMGYIHQARITTNSLILEGEPYSYDGDQRFKLIVRTGGTIKPGVYESANGDVGIQLYRSGGYTYYINDELGQLKVTITAINGNVVYGSFEGVSVSGKAIRSGTFACRVKDYQPQADAAHKWKFSVDESSFLYTAYGGNILSAQKTEKGGRYFLTINGESDHGTSTFKLVLSSNAPLAAGSYRSDNVNQRVDSLYFTSQTLLWNGNTTYLHIENSFVPDPNAAYCTIESISETGVVASLGGRIRIVFSACCGAGSLIRKGQFTAAF